VLDVLEVTLQSERKPGPGATCTLHVALVEMSQSYPVSRPRCSCARAACASCAWTAPPLCASGRR
jgi:hypothetical protein